MLPCFSQPLGLGPERLHLRAGIAAESYPRPACGSSCCSGAPDTVGCAASCLGDPALRLLSWGASSRRAQGTFAGKGNKRGFLACRPSRGWMAESGGKFVPFWRRKQRGARRSCSSRARMSFLVAASWPLLPWRSSHTPEGKEGQHCPRRGHCGARGARPVPLSGQRRQPGRRAVDAEPPEA